MDFGIAVATSATSWKLVERAEAAGISQVTVRIPAGQDDTIEESARIGRAFD